MSHQHEEQEAVAGLLCGLSSHHASKSEVDRTTEQQPRIVTPPENGEASAGSQASYNPRVAQTAGGRATAVNETAARLSVVIDDNTVAAMRQVTEMLLQNRPVVDPLKNEAYNVITPHPHDILSGRGNGANQHSGNIFFRNLIQKYKHHYIHTGPSEKKLITKKIVEEVQKRIPPGRFLKQNHETELWDCLDIDKVLKKTGQALREKAPELKKRAREEQKTRVTSSSESYFQNSRPTPGNLHALSNIQSNKYWSDPSTYSTTQFDSSDAPISTHKAPVGSFFMQPDVLNATAYQDIPLATASGGKIVGVGGPMSIVGSSGVTAGGRSGLGNVNRNDDSFNITRSAVVRRNQIIDPVHQKKTEELIAKVTSSGASLSNIYHCLRQNAITLPTVILKSMMMGAAVLPHMGVAGGFTNSLPLQQQQLIEQDVKVPVSVTEGCSETPHPHMSSFIMVPL